MYQQKSDNLHPVLLDEHLDEYHCYDNEFIQS